ncbi:putative vacuolar cation/proton exchanger 4 isoform X2 [Oryza brachyantha]|uniref:putative vacuolar cation/proton exchanger 4 isoform X2 n=1 Tax=Oryza brachyantha TaxID=4533 RepID=UPI000776679F|nr:putative vacuolar cation/proton exchanger 4 isoform X2 [Oryza brachyantha]
MTTDSSDSRRLFPGRQNSHQMDKINGMGPESTNQPPSLASRPGESEEEALVTPEGLSPRTGAFQIYASYVNWEILGSMMKIVFLKSKLNVFIPCGFLAILFNYVTQRHGWVFLLSMLGIIPLAERLGFATEQLALFTGPTAGGLLNAAFGNATKLIISIHALRSGKLRVVQQCLLGSILSNLLLVLGSAFFSGGLSCGKIMQTFSKADAVVNSGLLLMAVMGLLIPAALHYTHSEVQFGKSELALSRFSSCIMLVAYASYLHFQLSNNRHRNEAIVREIQNDGDDNDDAVRVISKWQAIAWLAIFTAWISMLSYYLVDAIDGASKAWDIPVAFISVVLLPIVGNSAGHVNAVIFAMKDRLDISLGIAIGSSIQISMFGIPFCVVLGWMMGKQMDLNFHLFETASLLTTVLVVAFLLQDGTSNCVKGFMLFLCYLIVSASFYVHADPHTKGDKPPQN